MNAITAHGRTYPSPTEALARIAELEAGNILSGRSDGRVTEIYLILGALSIAQANGELANVPDAKAAAWRSKQISDATRELAYLRESGRTKTDADHRVEYEDGTHRRVASYTTEEGFLKALIRMHSCPTRFTVIHVD